MTVFVAHGSNIASSDLGMRSCILTMSPKGGLPLDAGSGPYPRRSPSRRDRLGSTKPRRATSTKSKGSRGDYAPHLAEDAGVLLSFPMYELALEVVDRAHQDLL